MFHDRAYFDEIKGYEVANLTDLRDDFLYLDEKGISLEVFDSFFGDFVDSQVELGVDGDIFINQFDFQDLI